MRFWDTSAILPLILREPASSRVRALLELDAQLLVWWATRFEATSAIARRVRDGDIGAHALKTIMADLIELLRTALIVEPTGAVAERSERLLFNHALRAADALQLAAALVAVRERPRDVDFVSLDERLRAAAGREGFTVVP